MTDETTKERLVCFIKYIHACPRAGEQWLQSFVNYCKKGDKEDKICNQCIEGLKTAR